MVEAIYTVYLAKKEKSGYEIQRQLGVTYKTAWKMLKQIRVLTEAATQT